MINSFIKKAINVIRLIKGPSNSEGPNVAAAHAVVVRGCRFVAFGRFLASGAPVVLSSVAPMCPAIVLVLVVEGTFDAMGFGGFIATLRFGCLVAGRSLLFGQLFDLV